MVSQSLINVVKLTNILLKFPNIRTVLKTNFKFRPLLTHKSIQHAHFNSSALKYLGLKHHHIIYT